jgi:hypothetical protein
MAKKKDKWIQGADLNEGAFTAKATKAGMAVQEYAHHVLANEKNFDGETVKQANLAVNFKKMAKKRKAKK